MGTHAMIGVWHEETNEVIASYVHYDGYVEGVGKTLVEHYNDQSRAEIVAHGGYLSALFPSYIESRRDAVHNDRPDVLSRSMNILPKVPTSLVRTISICVIS